VRNGKISTVWHVKGRSFHATDLGHYVSIYLGANSLKQTSNFKWNARSCNSKSMGETLCQNYSRYQ
jgi:hypothetical protein